MRRVARPAAGWFGNCAIREGGAQQHPKTAARSHPSLLNNTPSSSSALTSHPPSLRGLAVACIALTSAHRGLISQTVSPAAMDGLARHESNRNVSALRHRAGPLVARRRWDAVPQFEPGRPDHINLSTTF